MFNLVPCDNPFERDFAKFLDHAEDVAAFAKLPQSFGFSIEYTDGAMNLRSYYPDFVAVDTDGRHWLNEAHEKCPRLTWTFVTGCLCLGIYT